MSNRFKFRVWNKIENRWLKQYEFLIKFNNLHIIIKNDVVEADDNYTAQQFTGLQDENGKEIYEGDIMASRGNYITNEIDNHGNYLDLYNVVVWNIKSSRFALKPVEEYFQELKFPVAPEYDYPWTCYLTCFKEVVGNVLENPELISRLSKLHE